MPATRWTILCCVLVLAAILGGCAGDGDGEPSETETVATTTAAGTTQATTQAADGGFTFRVIYDEGLDYLDPALSYTIQGWALMWHVYLPLLTYAHESGPGGATLVPALAEDLPEVDDDGRTYTFTVREGATYSDGKPILASDFKRAIERNYLMDSPGAQYFDGIEGATTFATRRKGGIAGIVADDAARTVEFRLDEPRGDFQHALATVFAAPVPKGTKNLDRSLEPIPASGPYMIRSYEPNRSVELVRNPRFEPVDGVARGNPDAISVRMVAEGDAALEQMLDDKGDYSFHPIPPDRLGDVRENEAARLKTSRLANTYYYFMNTRAPPFDKLDVRKAVNLAIDRTKVAELYGGLATPTQNVLPPDYPQYRELDLYPFDRAEARRLVTEAGARNAVVVVWATSVDTSEKPGEYLVDALDDIGMKASLRVVDPAVYFPTVGNQETHAQIGVANWFHDYPHPLSWFDPLLNGDRITKTGNSNLANANVEEINERIDELRGEPVLSEEVNEDWAEVDRLVMENALWAPFANRSFTEFFGSRMDLGADCYVSHLLYRIDYSSVCTTQ